MKWKLIETVAGRIEVVTGPGTETRPDWHQHEWLVWEGDATNSSDALRKAAQAEPKLDIQPMRLRHELDLTKIDIRTGTLINWGIASEGSNRNASSSLTPSHDVRTTFELSGR